MRLVAGIGEVLDGLSQSDAELVYQAIRLAQPGGMGTVDEQDIRQMPTQSLREVMQLAASRDLIARQYSENFSLVLEFGLPYLGQAVDFEQQWEAAIIGLQLELLAGYSDSLILRKCGQEAADETSQRAAAVLQAARPSLQKARTRARPLRSLAAGRGQLANPGTTADLIAASLFAAIRDGGVPVIQPNT